MLLMNEAQRLIQTRQSLRVASGLAAPVQVAPVQILPVKLTLVQVAPGKCLSWATR